MTNDNTRQPAADSPPDDVMMTMADVMTMLNLSRTKVWTMIQRDELPAFRFGGDYRFLKSEVLQWMERFRIQNRNLETNSTNKPTNKKGKKQ
jgi:excisionase family DNA binding protein